MGSTEPQGERHGLSQGRTLRPSLLAPTIRCQRSFCDASGTCLASCMTGQGTLPVSTISLEQRPPSLWNAVRHQGGTVFGIAWNTH